MSKDVIKETLDTWDNEIQYKHLGLLETELKKAIAKELDEFDGFSINFQDEEDRSWNRGRLKKRLGLEEEKC